MNKKIKCENCGEETIEVDETPSGYVVRRGFTGKRGKQYYNERIRYLTKNCPKCGAYHGKNQVDREKVMKRIRESGLPLLIKSEK